MKISLMNRLTAPVEPFVAKLIKVLLYLSGIFLTVAGAYIAMPAQYAVYLPAWVGHDLAFVGFFGTILSALCAKLSVDTRVYHDAKIAEATTNAANTIKATVTSTTTSTVVATPNISGTTVQIDSTTVKTK